MMLNLFSVFDPSTSNMFSMNWLIMGFILFTFPLNFYFKHSLMQFSSFYMLNFLFSEFSKIMSSKKSEGILMMFLMFFSLIFWSNYLGLLPFIFTSTSHLVISFGISFSIWLSLMIFGWVNNMKIMFSHLVPLGTPSFLMSFMVLIESISLLIRPITLSVRLSANMIAGHLLLTLLGNSFFNIPTIHYLFVYIPLIMLMMLELAVAMIQAYVFSMLILLYSMEIS